jgi:hypothetical protein
MWSWTTFEVPPQHLRGETRKIHEKHVRSRSPFQLPKYEAGILLLLITEKIKCLKGKDPV